MFIKPIYHHIRTLIRSRKAQNKPSLLPNTKHMEHAALKTNNDIRMFMYERMKSSDIVTTCKAKHDSVILIASMKEDHIAVNAYCVVKGSHNGDFISLRDVHKLGYAGAVLYRNGIYTVGGLARKLGNWSIQGKSVDYGYYEMEPFASFELGLSESELIWVRESLRQDHVQTLNLEAFAVRYA